MIFGNKSTRAAVSDHYQAENIERIELKLAANVSSISLRWGRPQARLESKQLRHVQTQINNKIRQNNNTSTQGAHTSTEARQSLFGLGHLLKVLLRPDIYL